MRPNMLLNIVGIMLILIAGLGLAVYEEPDRTEVYKPQTVQYDLSFPIMSGTGEPASGNIPDGGSDTVTVTISANNLTGVGFSIDWTDQNPQPVLGGTVTVEVSVTGPGGFSDSQSSSGRSGNVAFEFTELNSVYNETTIEVAEDANVDELIAKDYPPKTEGSGEWSISISVSRSPRQKLFLGSVDFTISSDFEYFVLEKQGPI